MDLVNDLARYPPGEGGGGRYPYKGLYREAPSERGRRCVKGKGFLELKYRKE